jgi:hypothetical protein
MEVREKREKDERMKRAKRGRDTRLENNVNIAKKVACALSADISVWCRVVSETQTTHSFSFRQSAPTS